MLTQNHLLSPLFNARNRQEFLSRISNDIFQEQDKFEQSLTSGVGRDFSVHGFCIPCNTSISFRVDMQAGGRQEKEYFFPNWRERLICPSCRMSNRQRLTATLVMQHLISRTTRQDIYLMEQTTPLFNWINKKFNGHSIVGSEYFNANFQEGRIIGPFDYQAPLRFNNLLNSARHKFSLFYSMLKMGGIRHEDVTKLSFPSASLDLLVSNDVFEHVPNPEMAFKECARVLRTGGQMFATIPFHSNSDVSVIRAKLDATGITHLLPAIYHGNPVSAEGSLVFTDFGWDIVKSLVLSGFSDVAIEVYGSVKYGHLGGGQLIFKATK